MKRFSLLLTILLSLVLWAHWSLGSDSNPAKRLLGEEGARWEITAKKLSYLQQESLYVAEGDVVVKRGSQVLSGDRAKYNERTGMIEVTGHVVLKSNGDILRAERAVFDLQSQTGQITGGHLFLKQNHYYISGETMEKTGPNTYVIKKCRVTTCDGTRPDWSITGSEVKVTVEGYGSMKNAVFRISNYPAFYFPYVIFPAKTKRQTGFLPPAVGYSSQNGAQLEVPFYWAISDQMDATFYEQYMSERGYMQGLEYRYVAEKDSKGAFLYDILPDDRKEKDLTNPDDIALSPFERTNQTRYWLRSRTNQQLPLGIRAKLDTDYVSDQDYLKEFQGDITENRGRPDLVNEFGRPMEEIQSPTRRSALRLDRDQPDYSLQALSAYYERPENPSVDSTPQPLGALNFSLLPRSLPGSPLFVRFDSDVNYVRREEGSGGQSVSLTPNVSYPMWFGRFLQFEPSVSYRKTQQRLDDPIEGTRILSRDALDFQTRVSTVLDRVYDIQWGQATKLRHKFQPSLIYEYQGNGDSDPSQLWFEPLDRVDGINRVSLSLENFLDARKEKTKEGEVSYEQWVYFNLIQGYNLKEARRNEDPETEKRPFEPLIGMLTLTPYPSLYFDAEVQWDYYESNIPYADVSLSWSIQRSGGRKDHIGLDYQYTNDANKGLHLRGQVNLIYGFSVGGTLSQNLSSDTVVQETVYLDYQSQCWGVRVVGENLEGINSFMVLFRLLGLGSLPQL
jgi:LPS-assembly protein